MSGFDRACYLPGNMIEDVAGEFSEAVQDRVVQGHWLVMDGSQDFVMAQST